MTATGLIPQDGVTEPHGSASLVLELCAKGPGQARDIETPSPGRTVPSPKLTVHMTNTHLDHVLDAAVGMLFNH